ncbi:MAG: hypothetical protein EOO99_07370 [Pedobacter sp.]|nr:MAG: hypothetical protein EOO99_07370 [Pedobacter sp.]
MRFFLKNLYIYWYITFFEIKKREEYNKILNKKELDTEDYNNDGHISFVAVIMISFFFLVLLLDLFFIYRTLTDTPLSINKGLVYLICTLVLIFSYILLFKVLKIEKLNYVLPEYQPSKKSLDIAVYIYWFVIIVGMAIGFS